ncbi:MAG TPA: hypothetical protein PKJ47_03740 [Candidatus Limiplasma sp.]|nr:hypothetical protein [Candidatus Limiplasma sp.]
MQKKASASRMIRAALEKARAAFRAPALKRIALGAVCVCACAVLTGCAALQSLTAALPAQTQASSGPNLDLLALPAYEDQEGGESAASDGGTAYGAVDLWLDATQNAGGISALTTSMYPHAGKKYREGGFHYRYGTQTGWYESLLRDFLTAAGDTRVRTLRNGNETFPEGVLEGFGLAAADAEAGASLWRDLHTCAVDTQAGLFSQFSAEEMANSFYSLGSAVWNNRLNGLDTQLLENSTLSGAMSAALTAQTEAIAAGDAGYVLAAGSDGQQCAFYNALENLDPERLSIITVDPASVRKVSGSDADGQPVAWYEQALRERGVFDRGLCVGVLDFTLDYLGQMSSVGIADLSEPLVWGRVILDEKKQTFENLGVMPRQMLTFVIGSKTMVNGFIQRLKDTIDADRSLRGLRGPQNGELTYTANGQTVTQQPFSFSWQATVIARPGMGYYTQHTEGTAFAEVSSAAQAEETAAATGADGLPLFTLVSSADGSLPDYTLKIRFPIATSDDGAKLDVSKLSGASVDTLSTLLLTQTLANTAANRETAPAGAQVIPYRDKLYVFESGKADGAFTLAGVEQVGDELVCSVQANGKALQTGYYRLRLSADVTADQVTWEQVPWIDGEDSLSVSITDADAYAWETFTAAMTEYDRDAKGIPKMFQHAWGSYTDKLYHGLRVPDFPPVYKAFALRELTGQVRAAAASDTSPLIRCAFEVFVPGR